MSTLSLVKRKRKLSSCCSAVFFFFSPDIPSLYPNIRKSLFIKIIFSFLDFLYLLGRPRLETWGVCVCSGGGLPEIFASLRLKALFSLTLCLIQKLGDSYLWQLRDSTHRDPPTTVEGRGKISDISMACSTDMDTVSLKKKLLTAADPLTKTDKH